ncbi:MAG: hypothetical protein WDW38_005991 [Sanguina aurantia]
MAGSADRLRRPGGLTQSSLPQQRNESAAARDPSAPVPNAALADPTQQQRAPPQTRTPYVSSAGTHASRPGQQQQSPPPSRDSRPGQTRNTDRPPSHDTRHLSTGLAVTWLGTSSGAPTVKRNVSCTLVSTPAAIYQVDCGEGTHRQLLDSGTDLSLIERIFITHLHGDHCFGLGSAVLLIDVAKSKRGDPNRMQTHVYGPLGVADLLRVTLLTTGLARQLQLPLIVTELVVDPDDAHPPEAVDDAGLITISRMGPSLIEDDPELKADAAAVAPDIKKMPVVWRPPRPQSSYHPSTHTPVEPTYVSPSSIAGSDADEEDLEMYGGRSYVAAHGIYWDIPCGEMHVRAAQLQHRVACWGYVMTENECREGAERRRKVVILGDTIDSSALAPLALSADLLAHEATYMAGMEDQCRKGQHSAAWMAGRYAAAIKAQQLVLTHFSARYGGPDSYQRGGNEDFDENTEEGQYLAFSRQSEAVKTLIWEAEKHYRPGGVIAARDFLAVQVPMAGAAAPSAASGTRARS